MGNACSRGALVDRSNGGVGAISAAVHLIRDGRQACEQTAEDCQVTEFDRMRTHLEDSVAMMSVVKRALFLLAYAQRLSPLFEEFERRAPPRRERFSQVLDRLWRVAAGEPPNPLEKAVLDAMIPGEEWVVDGFYDALAQDVGGLAVGALEGMLSPEGIVLHPEATVFDLIRLLLSEMRLGRSEPGEDTVGLSFDASLHTELLVEEERQFWVGLVDLLEGDAVEPEGLRSHAVREALKISKLQPALALGLAKDTGEMWQG